MVRSKVNYPFLPQVQDLLRLIENWCRSTGVTKAELARLLDVDRSAMTNVFSGRRRLLYDESEQILDYLINRLSPLPNEPIRSLCVQPRGLKRVQFIDTVGRVASKLIEGEFTQAPVFDDNRFVGLATDRMILERLLRPNQTRFDGRWIDKLRQLPLKKADVIETSAIYPMEASISSVANALRDNYAVMVSDDGLPRTIVTRWDYLKLLAREEAS